MHFFNWICRTKNSPLKSFGVLGLYRHQLDYYHYDRNYYYYDRTGLHFIHTRLCILQLNSTGLVYNTTLKYGEYKIAM